MKNNTLDLTSHSKLVSIPDTLKRYEPARVSRYLIMASLISQGVGTKAKVLDVGGKEGLLREFGVATTIIDMEYSDQPNFIHGDALNMPFKDNSFDITVSCDVLEHIPAEHRNKFVAEMVRVTKEFAIICAPFNQGGVAASEKAANKFYKEISGEDHRWLIEHIDNGIPNRKSIESFIKKQKLEYKFFKHLSLDIWDQTTKAHFLEAVFGDSKGISKLAKESFAKYYKDVCAYDYGDNGYRTFCVINKKRAFNLTLPPESKQQAIKADFKQFLTTQLVDALKDVAVDHRKLQAKSHSMQSENAQLNAELVAKTTELKTVYNSKTWKLTQKLSRVKNFYK